MIVEVYTKHAKGSSPVELDWCPYTKSLIGRDIENLSIIVLPIRCKRWTCPYCRVPNEILLKEKVVSGGPNKMLTLTVRPDPGETPGQTFKRVRRAIPRLYQECRRYCGRWEAATFMERHRSGYPHWHALIRSNYVPQKFIADEWRRLTGSWIVDIRRINDDAVARRYVTKYVTKQFQQWHSLKLGHVVSFTRHYSMLPKKEVQKSPLLWTMSKQEPRLLEQEFPAHWKRVWKGRILELQWTPC